MSLFLINPFLEGSGSQEPVSFIPEPPGATLREPRATEHCEVSDDGACPKSPPVQNLANVSKLFPFV